MRSGISQAFVYMQQQRCMQPYMRFVLGMSVTASAITVIRADCIGTERQSIDKTTGSGVMEVIQLALGLTIADDEHLGVHPAFEFKDVVTSQLSTRNAGVSTPTGAMKRAAPSPNDEPIPQRIAVGDSKPGQSSRRYKPAKPSEFRYRQAAFINFRGMKRHYPPIENKGDHSEKEAHSDETLEHDSSRYYLDYLASNSGALAGRRTRVWCAYKEVGCDDPVIHEEDRPKVMHIENKVYVGPYALKFQDVDISSEAHRLDIVGLVRQEAIQNPEAAKYVLLPDMYASFRPLMRFCSYLLCSVVYGTELLSSRPSAALRMSTPCRKQPKNALQNGWRSSHRLRSSVRSRSTKVSKRSPEQSLIFTMVGSILVPFGSVLILEKRYIGCRGWDLFTGISAITTFSLPGKNPRLL